jgi:hypothetical protein
MGRDTAAMLSVAAGVRHAASGLATAGQAVGSGLQAVGRGLAHGDGTPQTPGSFGVAPYVYKFDDPYTLLNMQSGATPPPAAIADPPVGTVGSYLTPPPAYAPRKTPYGH